MPKTLHQQIETAGHKVYGQVNRMWPNELPILEKIEAERAYKRLIAKFGKKKVWSEYSNKWITEKMKVRRIRKRGTKTWKTRVRKCWLSLNGDTNSLSKGWRRLVHDVSHYVYHFRFPDNSESHNIAQAKIEQEMTQFVNESGWLIGWGKLKPTIKQPLTKDEKQIAKSKTLIRLIRSWETKESRAKTYIKKYRLKLKRINPTMRLDDFII
jgi:hypothetical protein